ncbi:hypothetical protein QG37_00819 [Candidozyma auris]|nr:hypothetical protein QG37_00819 [[Candida] auris]
MGMYGGIGSPSSLWRIVATSYASSNWLPENRLPDFLVLSPSSFTRPKRGQKKKKKKKKGLGSHKVPLPETTDMTEATKARIPTSAAWAIHTFPIERS